MATERIGEGVALRSTSTIVGMWFNSVTALGDGFSSTDPISGKVQLEGLFVSMGGSTGASLSHRLTLAIRSEQATSQNEIEVSELVFPRAGGGVIRVGRLAFPGPAGQFFIPLNTVLAINGRRLVGMWENGDSVVQDFYVGLVLHRVEGGESTGDPGFLSGESVRDA